MLVGVTREDGVIVVRRLVGAVADGRGSDLRSSCPREVLPSVLLVELLVTVLLVPERSAVDEGASETRFGFASKPAALFPSLALGSADAVDVCRE